MSYEEEIYEDYPSVVHSVRGSAFGLITRMDETNSPIHQFLDQIADAKRRSSILDQSETWVNAEDRYVNIGEISARYADNIRLWLLAHAEPYYRAQLFTNWFKGIVDNYSKTGEMDLERYRRLATDLLSVSNDHELAKDFVKMTKLYQSLAEAANRPF